MKVKSIGLSINGCFDHFKGADKFKILKAPGSIVKMVYPITAQWYLALKCIALALGFESGFDFTGNSSKVGSASIGNNQVK